MNFLGELVNILIVLLSVVLGPIVAKLLLDFRTAYLSSEKGRQIVDSAMTYVLAAEQMMTDNDQRLKYALDLLSAKFPDLPVQEVRAHIEAAVISLKNMDSSVEIVQTYEDDGGGIGLYRHN